MQCLRVRRRSAGAGATAWRAGAIFLLASGWAMNASAQDETLRGPQERGRQIFSQACSICHLAPSMGAATYGPALHRGSAAGNDDLMRAFITEGTARMPAFKYHLKPSEVNAVIAYLRTVPVRANTQLGATP